MADGKLTYDIDFNVNTDRISEAIARAVAGARGQITPNSAPIHAYDAAIAGLGQRTGLSYLREDAAFGMGLGDIPGTKNSFARFASMAAANPYGYTPSTIQSMMRSSVANAMRDYEVSPDLQYKLDIERITNQLRAQQRENRLSALAGVYATQGYAFAQAAANASTPEAQKLLLGRAAGRYGSIASRTLMEAGAVDPETAAEALGISAELSSIRSGIKTQAQAAAQKDKEYDLMEAAVAKKSAEEDAAWATRGYSETQKAREIEEGFRAMGASSATEAIYNPNTDPSVRRWNYGASLYAAAQYAADAEKAPAGSPERSAYIALAKESMRGITVSGMAQSGMHKDELARNTTALIGLTNLLKTLSGEDGGEPEVTGGGWFSNPKKAATIAAALVNTGVAVTRDVMQGRTQWLADTQSPYQTRRDVRQGWAMKYGEQARKLGVGAGALAGASLGTAILPGIGTVVGGLGGALVGAIPGGVAELWGQHNADEKKIGDAYQQRAVDMLKYRNLYGNGVEYNYAQFAGDTGYISASGMLQLNQAADMLPGAMMFGAVDERQMMALSYMPNYWRALMAGASTSELASAYAGDISSLPREMQQYITSLLPGASEDLRAFVKSEGFSALQGNAGVYRGYDENQYGMATGYDRARQVIAHRNVASLNKNMTNETAVASAPNYYRSDSAYAMAMSDYDAIYETDPGAAEDAWNRTRRKLGLREFDVGNNHGKLGDIIIQIDGNTIYQEEYSTESFISGLQSYVVGV